MMSTQKLESLLATAKVKRIAVTPNSDEFVVRKLRKNRAERQELLHKIATDLGVSDQAAVLEAEIASIDNALTAYPELAPV